jgi:predicted nucleic acid-binding protein
VSVYLDASVLVALFTRDVFTARSDAFLRDRSPELLISDFAAAEFTSAVALRTRRGDLTRDDARLAFSRFDAWTHRVARRAETRAADVAAADALLRRLDLPLRTPDALNIAIAQREKASLMTFDVKMAASTRALGLAVAAA